MRLRIGFGFIGTPCIRFVLAGYEDIHDFIQEIPFAVGEWNQGDQEADFFREKMYNEYRLELDAIVLQKKRQGRTRALRIIKSVFKDNEDIYIVLQGSKGKGLPCGIEKDIKYLAYNLKGKKLRSQLLAAKDPYDDPNEEEYRGGYFRLLFRHRFADIKLNSLLKKKIYNPSHSEIYFISASDDPPRIVNVYDDRGLDVCAPASFLKNLQEEFLPWVKEVMI